MDRRSFLKSILVGAAALATSNIEKIINETSHLNDNEFVTYITLTMNLYVTNPSKCFIITNIEES